MNSWIETVTYKEGKMEILAPKPFNSPKKAPAFFNPHMSFNRDLSVLVLKAYRNTFSDTIRICDAMTGVGIRGIRYASEIDGVYNILLNDLNPLALQFAEYNTSTNKVDQLITLSQDETNRMLALNSYPSNRFDIVDLDPFGTPVQYFDSAILATKIGGIIAATATDMPVLCGLYPNVANRNYGVSVYPTPYAHEVALRILIYAIIRAAALHSIAVSPLFCFYADHYIRIHLALSAKKGDILQSFNQLGRVLHCPQCMHRTIITTLYELYRFCPICNSKLQIIGPLWLGHLFEKKFCQKMSIELSSTSLINKRRVIKMLDLAIEESNAPPFFYSLNILCDRLNIPQPKCSSIIEKLLEQGFSATRSHIHGNGVKTNAPLNAIETILKS